MSPIDAVNAAQAVIVTTSMVVLGAAAGFTLYRMAKGPTNLDRIIASDLIVGIVVAGLGLHILITDEDTTLTIMLAISLIGFIGAVAMARFVRDRQAEQPDVRRSRRRAGDGTRPTVRGERPAGPHIDGDRRSPSGSIPGATDGPGEA